MLLTVKIKQYVNGGQRAGTQTPECVFSKPDRVSPEIPEESAELVPGGPGVERTQWSGQASLPSEELL